MIFGAIFEFIDIITDFIYLFRKQHRNGYIPFFTAFGILSGLIAAIVFAFLVENPNIDGKKVLFFFGLYIGIPLKLLGIGGSDEAGYNMANKMIRSIALLITENALIPFCLLADIFYEGPTLDLLECYTLFSSITMITLHVWGTVKAIYDKWKKKQYDKELSCCLSVFTLGFYVIVMISIIYYFSTGFVWKQQSLDEYGFRTPYEEVSTWKVLLGYMILAIGAVLTILLHWRAIFCQRRNKVSSI